MAAPEEDYSSLPLTERVKHKIWKVRVGAYEELTKLFKKSDNESDFKPYEGFMKNIATDSNAVAQETGLTTLLAFVENAPNPLRVRGSIIPAVVDKGFGSSRAGTKKKAIELVLLYIEVDSPDPVVVDVLEGLNAKQPKLVATTVSALKDMIRVYGAKTVNVKPILKTIPKIFAHTDKNVRSEGTQLVIELYKWLGKAIDPHLSELKPVQIKELNEAFEKLPQEKPTQERLLRSQVAAAEAAAEAGKGDEAEAEEEKEIDAYDLAEPVDILSKMSKDFYTLLGSSKWKERKEALEAFLEVCKTPRIADNNYSELAAALAKRITDANILVVTLAANAIEALALGLRESFAKYKTTVMTPLIEKLKERKQSVVDALSAALDAVFLSVTISDITEDVLAAGKHKNPQVKSESMKFLVRCIKNTKTSPQKAEIKSLTEMMVKASEDSFEPVRISAFEGLGTMMKVIGEKAMNTFLEGLDDIKKGKIKEYYDKAEVKIKFSTAKKPPPPTAAPSKGDAPKGKPAAKPAAKKEAGSAPKKVAAKPGGPPKKAPAAKVQSAPSAAAPPPKKGGKAKEEVITFKFTNEGIEGKFAELVPEDQTANLSEKNWKLRLEAIENLQTTLEEMDPSEIEAELVIRFLSKKPGWKESNFQVLSKAFNIIEELSQKVPSFGKPAAALAIPIFVEKLGDIKLKKSAGDALMAFSEKISLQFVLSQAYEPLNKAKAPKILADNLLWIYGAIMEFGIAGLQVRELIEFLKVALGSSNASVRTNAVTVLGALRIFVGPDIRTFVQDLNPTQLATIDSEFEKVASQEPPKSLRPSAEVVSVGGSGKNPIEELFPKVDIGAQFTSKMMAECNDDKWKVRKDALEQVLAIVDANKKIKPNLGEFVPILKARLGDSNKNLQMMSLDITGKIATAMGKPFERHVKILVGPVTAVLTDQKVTVRSSAISTLDALANACGLDPLVGSFSTSLATENPLLRKDLLSWLSERLKEAAESDKKNALPDLSPMVQPILSCLQDRNGEVRKAAQSCLSPIVKSAGYDYVVAKCGDLKGAVKQTIMPMIEAVRPTGPSGPTAKKDAKKTKSRLAAPSGKDKDDDEENMEDDEPAKLPPGLVLRPPANSALNKPTTSLANPLPAANPVSGISTNGLSSQLSGPPPSGISRLQSPLQRGGIPSGIGRGLTPSKLQFSRTRPSMNGTNGQIPAASNDSVDEIESKRDLSSMEVDKSEHSISVNNEMNAPTKQRVFMVDNIITKILSTEFQQSIEALKELDKQLNTSPESIIRNVDELVNALAIQLRISYTQLKPQSPSLVRLCKHLVNALVLLFSNKDLALAVSQDSLDRLLSELAHRLLDPNLTAVDGGSQLSKAINVSMVKVLEHSNRNRTYSALISILGKSSSNLREVDAETAATQTKFTELIMKCLWKLAKTVQENLKAGTLLPNQLLRDLNNFFLAIPPAEWKRREKEKVLLGELPLRTVKTLLLELVTGLGENVYEKLDLIEDPQKSYVYPYLHHMLEATKKKDKQAGNQAIADNNTTSRPSSIASARSISSVGSDIQFSTTDSARDLSPQRTPTQTSIRNSIPARNSPINEPQTRSSPPTRDSPVPDVPGHINETMSNASEPVSPASPRTPMTPKFPTPTVSARSSGSHEVEMNARLTQIFLKIGSREETKKGIYELYEFQKQHPEMEGKITTQLSRTGTHFQSYIRRGLANIASEEEEKERANVIAEAKKNLLPQDNNRENNLNQSEDLAYKQKLLRLQQVFGYRETGNE
ncbi:microtubule associated protein [Rhizophagus clarus]|uniref:Microtubule associated protein n=1 Tax=Rhizophagus clarus TaxID=94130 RepID=A0A8H3MEB9_9GLOM|nr:microtubule associated protein [Rhizophagus clarus]